MHLSFLGKDKTMLRCDCCLTGTACFLLSPVFAGLSFHFIMHDSSALFSDLRQELLQLVLLLSLMSPRVRDVRNAID